MAEEPVERPAEQPAEPSLDCAASLPPDVMAAATEVLGQDPATRDQAFAALCATHPDHLAPLRQMFSELLAIERLLSDGDDQPEETPANLGPFRVVRRLGNGAFGEVFLCEQVDPVRRAVAVKVLRAGVGDRTTLRRFASERQLIASLQHPAIAQVFDAGTLEDGRPYFVMDAIDGTPIDHYCDHRALTIEARVALFCDLCRGVQHAHDRGIVHRDLKPANVLVVDVDGQPRPKVIDFGIAKVLQGSSVVRSFDTDAGRVIGTPGYMSPEQQKGSSDDVDARADVFCLGVMLYQLLCGHLPWSADGADGTDSDPQRPSTRVSASVATATSIASRRSTEPRRLASHLRGDLDWIVLKCLQRERTQRYQTVHELIHELERYGRGEPVHAGPPTAAYRLKKFVRRHRYFVTAIASTALVATCSLLLFLHYRRSANDEIEAAKARAEASFADAAAAVAQLLERANDPDVREAPQGDALREAMLQDALSFYDRFLLDRPTDPALRAKRCRTFLGLAHVHWLLGDAPRATDCAQVAMQEAELLHAADSTSIELRGLLGEALYWQGSARSLARDPAAALAAFQAAVAHLQPCAEALPAQFGCRYGSALCNAAMALAPHLIEQRLQGLRAGVQFLDGLRSIEPSIPDLAYEYVLASCALGEDLRIVPDLLPEAEAVLQQADAELPKLAAERPELAYRVSALRAQVLSESGQWRSAVVQCRAAVAAVAAWAQAQPKRLLPRTTHVHALQNLGYAQNYLGDFDDSVRCFREAIAIGEELTKQVPTDGARAEALARSLYEFALTLYDRSRRSTLAEAAACAERAVSLDAQGAAGDTLDFRWRRLGLQAQIADAAAPGGGDRYWPGVEAALQPPLEPVGRARDDLLGNYVGLARWHLDHDRTAAASASLQQADAWIAREPKFFAKRTVDVGWLTARLAAARADHGACAIAADRVLAARPTWYGRRRAADCLHLAWRCARNDAGAADEAIAYRDRALAMYQQVLGSLSGDVEADPTDPWFVLPWGFASIRAAELTAATGNSAAALELLAASLPRLLGVRAEAHADLWDEQAYREAQALHDKLAAAGR